MCGRSGGSREGRESLGQEAQAETRGGADMAIYETEGTTTAKRGTISRCHQSTRYAQYFVLLTDGEDH